MTRLLASDFIPHLDTSFGNHTPAILQSNYKHLFPSSQLSILSTMSLKRKSSFTGLPATASVSNSNEWNIALDGGSTHLHSRTRKRFRDDRPSESVIYREFLAQKPKLAGAGRKLC